MWLSGIRDTQGSHPPAHCQEGTRHCVSLDRLADLAGLLVADTKEQEEVAEYYSSIGSRLIMLPRHGVCPTR